MLATWLPRLRRRARRFVAAARARVAGWLRPVPLAIIAGAAIDTTRSRSELVLENALLRQRPAILGRTAKRPRLTALDRGLIVLPASRLRSWAQALVIVQPATVLRWHRQGFRLFWRRKSMPRSGNARIPAETVALIRRIAAAHLVSASLTLCDNVTQARRGGLTRCLSGPVPCM